ncbi:MAG: hypothetical protein J1E43_10610 [Christensenellaceae bacterium]|nr:hypothetical protein [Christensenellaceae bacterium]
MKRLLICLLLLMLPCAALADEAAGPLALFADNPDYAGYACVADNLSEPPYDRVERGRLIMGSGDHLQLVCVGLADGVWRIGQTSTTALYQPGEEKAGEAVLHGTAEGFTLFYPDEEYEFILKDGEWALTFARVGGLTYDTFEGGVEVSDGSSAVIWQVGGYWDRNAWVTLEDFNISLFPRSLDEVRRLNALRALISGGSSLQAEPVTEAAEELLPVYSAPAEDSWRAAEGKAAVSLRDTDGLRTYGLFDGWELIEYRVGLSRSRVGYIQHEGEQYRMPFARVPVVADTETWLTDDPGVSQTPVMTIPAGAELTALECYNPFYVYVETELNGQAIRGFVPLRDLLPADQPAAKTNADDLPGAWYGYASWTGQYLALGEIGRFTSYDAEALPDDPGALTSRELYLHAEGRWYPLGCPEGRFEDEYNDALMLIYDDGRAFCLGLRLEDGVLGLNPSEGAWKMERVQPQKGEIQRDAMSRIAGTYAFEAGGTHLTEGELVLGADGTVRGSDEFGGQMAGTWYLTYYNPAEGYIWNDPPYTACFELDTGATLRLGCMPKSLEESGYVGVQSVIFSDGEGSGSYVRSNVDVAAMAAVSGNYAFASGGMLLTGGLLRLHSEGYFYSEVPSGDAMSGFWMLSRDGEGIFGDEYPCTITFLVSDNALVHPGETLVYGCRLTSSEDGAPTTLVITDGEDSAAYHWEEEAGNG